MLWYRLCITIIKSLALLIPLCSAHAADYSGRIEQNRELLTVLSETRVWLKLLGYTDSSQQSQIISPAFFFSEDGNTNPYDELIATLEAFRTPVDDDLDDHPLCRFPARAEWLSRQLDLEAVGIERIHCPDFFDFSGGTDKRTVSLIYVSGYLGNPASYYGHLLLRINSDDEELVTDLTSAAVNFGAIIPEDENMVSYILKGILGRYSSGYTHREYFYHTHNYGETELRDMWDYELELSNEDEVLLISHIWELIGQQYQYYFFNRNCAYQIAQAVSLVLDDDLIDSRRLWVLPQNVIEAVTKAKAGGEPVIRNIAYLPSRQSRFYGRYISLNPQEKDYLHEAVGNSRTIDDNDLRAQSIAGNPAALDTLMDYFSYLLVDAEDQEADLLEQAHRKALLQRLALPIADREVEFSTSSAPHQERSPSYVSLGTIHNDGSNLSGVVNFRPAYYDSLDGMRSELKNSSLIMGAISLGIDTKSWIRSLDILKIERISRNLTHLPGDSGYSWTFNIGAQQSSLECKECLSTLMSYAAGYSLSVLDEKLRVSGFIGGGFFSEKLTSEGWFVSPSLRVNFNHKIFSAQIDWNRREFNGQPSLEYISIESRLSLTRNTDLRLWYREMEGEEFGVTLGVYW